jgi:plastocyanin
VQFAATATALPPPNLAIALAAPSGNNQTAVVGTTLPEALRVVVTNNGTPEQGVIVIWETPSPNGFFNPPQALTNAQGIASSMWTLGTTLGTHAATATAGQAGGPNVAFAAIATQGPGGGTVNVALSLAGGGQFSPANVVIAAGTTVRWTWTDSPHTVTSTGTPSFPDHAAQANAPTVYEHTFTTSGNYSYFCSVHGTASTGMRGTVVVQ